MYRSAKPHALSDAGRPADPGSRCLQEGRPRLAGFDQIDGRLLSEFCRFLHFSWSFLPG